MGIVSSHPGVTHQPQPTAKANPSEEGGMGSDRAGTPNDCAKPAKSWIFTSESSGILCDIGIDSRGSLVALVESSVPNDINYRLITPPACPLAIPAPPGPRGASREEESTFRKNKEESAK